MLFRRRRRVQSRRLIRVNKKNGSNAGRGISTARALKASLFSASYIAFGVLIFTETQAQTTPQQGQAGAQLPPVEVTAPEARRRASNAPVKRADRAGQRRRSQATRQPDPQAAPKPFAVSQDARTGTVGVYANSTSIATKTNTPLVNIPQSVSVVTREFIKDQGFQSLPDVHRGTFPASRSIRARAIATNSSSAASIPAPIFSSTAFVTTSSISVISTTPRASKS